MSHPTTAQTLGQYFHDLIAVGIDIDSANTLVRDAGRILHERDGLSVSEPEPTLPTSTKFERGDRVRVTVEAEVRADYLDYNCFPGLALRIGSDVCTIPASAIVGIEPIAEAVTK